ncbi:putative PDZ domain, TLDc domain, PDZ superfamily protein [Plasmopara halstedii]
MFSVRGLVRAIFDEQRQLMPRRKAQNNESKCVRSWDKGSTEIEPTYVPKTFEGEYNVYFHRKPLGVGLVPSSQLYGSWEVSSVQDIEKTDECLTLKDGENKTDIVKGDVLIAVNFSCRKAHLPRAHLAAYLQKCSCPISMTLRNPEVYGSLDSQTMSTAMYPSSVEYDPDSFIIKVVARASSMQWKRSLEHDLALNAVAATSEKFRLLAQALVSMDVENNYTASSAGKTKLAETPESDNFVCNLDDKIVADPILSEQGEFDVTFDVSPIDLALAPSTRIYGSVEVYDPKSYAPTIHVGDVIMAVNGCASMSRLTSDEVIDAIAELQAPVLLRFRRPVAYRKYLSSVFHTKKKKLSSESIASAMFPHTAEYKRRASNQTPKQVILPEALVSQSFIEPPTTSVLTKNVIAPVEDRARELRIFAAKIGALDQFKLWAGGSKGFYGGRSLAGHQSAFLTEKHMRFLQQNLPHYLNCSKMELVYSTRVHGWNFLSFFDRLQNKGPTILCVQDEDDNVFGAFCSASWKRSKSFFGNGRTFVFSLSSQMTTYSWSGIDSSFMYTQPDAIFIGGGNKGIALCLQLDDRRGFTHACTTFNSPPLVDHQSFRCDTVEVWSFYGLKL